MIEENNMGNMDAIQARDFFWSISDSLGLGGSFGFGITTANSICLGDRILIDENDLGYPWHTKQMILHEITHHLIPGDKTHGTQFHKKYAELVARFLAGSGTQETLRNWLIERRRKLKEQKECQLQLKPKDIQSARVSDIKAGVFQEVINYLGQ